MMKLTKEERSWVLYDCGNSAYSMAVTTALLPIVFGMFRNVQSSMDLGYFNSIASIFIAILSPILGTIADYKDKKKRFFIFFAFLGILSTAALAFVSPASGQWQLLILFFILSAIGFAGSNIFYDSFLVDITPDDRMDKVSTSGFAFGYISSVIPFGLSLVLVFLLGMDKAIGYQIGFIVTALWWGLLTVPMIRDVRQKHYIDSEPNPIGNSFKRLAKTFRNIKQHKTVFVFLIAYFLYIDGVDTIIKMVVPYATTVLGTNALDTFTLLGIFIGDSDHCFSLRDSVWQSGAEVFCQEHDYRWHFYLHHFLYRRFLYQFSLAYFHFRRFDRLCARRHSSFEPVVLCQDYP